MGFVIGQDDISLRWENYRKANAEGPLVRESELLKVFSFINAKVGERIWEVGTGNGYLTFPLAGEVGNSGEVITTDVHKGNIDEVIKRNLQRNLNIKAVLLSPFQPLLNEKYGDYFDTVTTIATLHHFDNRQEKTEEVGRKKALQSFYKNLKRGGKLVIGDVLYGTISQKYFDAIDNPEHCYPVGHPHDFFTEKRLYKVVDEVGFQNIQIEVAKVPWKFNSIGEAKNFVHTIHNARCNAEESFEIARKYLGFKKIGDHYELGWELFFLTAVK